MSVPLVNDRPDTMADVDKCLLTIKSLKAQSTAAGIDTSATMIANDLPQNKSLTRERTTDEGMTAESHRPVSISVLTAIWDSLWDSDPSVIATP
jgi:hypothetical protein